MRLFIQVTILLLVFVSWVSYRSSMSPLSFSKQCKGPNCKQVFKIRLAEEKYGKCEVYIISKT